MNTAPQLGSWRKSSYSSGSDNCVEISETYPGVVGVRDSKNPDGSVLILSRRAWAAFVDGLRAGEIVRV